MEEIVQDFLVECYEMLDQLDESFVMLEENPADSVVLGSIFRVLHTIKGTCSFLGFTNLEHVSHKGENLLSLLRDAKLALDTEITDALLATVDAIREYLGVIERTGADEGPNTDALIATLIELAGPAAETDDPSETDAAADDTAPIPTEAADAVSPMDDAAVDDTAPIATAGEAAAAAEAEAEAAAAEAEAPAELEAEAPAEVETDAAARAAVSIDEAAALDAAVATAAPTADAIPEATPPAPRIGDLLVEASAADRTTVEIAAAEQEFGDPRRIGEILVDAGEVAEADVAGAVTQQQTGRSGAADSTVRVDVAVLDDLMNLVGELVLTRNEIVQQVTLNPDGAMNASAQRLNMITSELQEGVMKTRMQPIGNVWSKLPRVVRDLANQCHKKVRIEMTGKETELDKTIIEAIKDPLTHIVRNTVDHGIEAPTDRTAAGKPVEGVLRLEAGHEGGQVIIEITDDGAGIDLDKIKAKAIERGLIRPDTAAKMSDIEATQLIFHPGLSTAKAVTNVSGRGVGMDVVKTNIEKIGGSVEVRTAPGQGTTFKIKIPLTLAIVPALIIGCDGRRYAIPQISLVELVRVDADETGKGIEAVHGAPVFRLRGRLLPVVDLRTELGLDAADQPPGDMVVVHAEDRQFGLLVDDIFETQEIVVKPLSAVVQELDIFSGATILGDGRVALIVDVLGLGHQASIFAARGEGTAKHDHEHASETTDQHQTLLLLAAGGDRRVAMPLADVARLEEFAGSAIESTGYRDVVQYRDSIMPLIDLASELGYGGAGLSNRTGTLSVVVVDHLGADIGLVIDEVLDIVDQRIVPMGGTGLVVHGRVTELLDVAALPSLAAIARERQLIGVS
jgi:two-component system chemotaxis sensor kinase CheA